MNVKVLPYLLALAALVVSDSRGTSHPRSLTIEDCVLTRRIVDGEVKMSPDGSSVAYVVKSPDIVANRNNYQLFIRDLHRSKRATKDACFYKAIGFLESAGSVQKRLARA